jgi:hypothetical protein
MAYLTYTFESSLKESQKSTENIGQMSVSGSDLGIAAFDAGKQISLAKGETKVVDLSSYSAVSFISVKVLEGQSVRVRLKKAERNSTDLVVTTFFGATVEEIEKIELVAALDTAVKVLLMVAGK